MSKFEPGSIVECIDATHCDRLTLGAVYAVIDKPKHYESGTAFVYLAGINEYSTDTAVDYMDGFGEWRFKLENS